jgi:predicted TIM-barrel enzyme
MIDYKNIADNDPGGDLEIAFATMAAMTVSSTPEKMLTYIGVAKATSFAAAVELQASVKANVPEWVDSALNGDGIDVNDSQSQALLNSIVSKETADAIIASGVETNPVYPGLKVGHLANARQKRAKGVI